MKKHTILLIIAGALVLGGGILFFSRLFSFSDTWNCRSVRVFKLMDNSYVCTESSGFFENKSVIVLFFEGPGIPLEGGAKIAEARIFYLDPKTKEIIAEAMSN